MRTADEPPAVADQPEESGGGGGSSLVIACRFLDDPREECSYCDDLGTYQIRNGADPEFEPVCSRHGGEFLLSMGQLMYTAAPLPPQ